MRAYNPLSVDELGRNAARALIEYPAAALPPSVAFDGAGVYTLHYTGTFPAYAGIGTDVPIYVGKADPPGRRQGRTQTSTTVLHSRLQEHAGSIESASNLELADFRCRWLVLDPVWIGLTEQVLIAQYQPVWNVVVDGFGNHDPGAGRRNQRRSRWDTLHPGREWASSLRDRGETAPDVIAAIKALRERR
ncbi:MAG: Eco29kI family restriction endonuclease [Chloroflexota bacterium]|nr:Eco29kI family restriction endonuclease [Chloroflexota bacterium]MDE2684900.1 Eco29kI family restriction endonuclease [Chloroflexota bacterium]